MQIKTLKKEQKEEKEEKMTRTDYYQLNIEKKVLQLFEEADFNTKDSVEFKGEAKYYSLAHYNFIKNLITSLPSDYSSLDS